MLSLLKRTLIHGATAVLLLAGCHFDNPASSGNQGAEWVDLVTRTGTFPENEHSLIRAENLLIQRCMKRHGFKYPAITPATRSATEELLDMDRRRAYGYGLFDAHSGTARPESTPLSRYVKSLTPHRYEAYKHALLGAAHDRRAIELVGGASFDFPTRGCQAEAKTRLYGDPVVAARVTYLPQATKLRVSKDLEKAPEYAGAIAAWSTCMAGRGYSYLRPESAADALAAQYQVHGADERLHALEIRTAVDDGECAHDVGLPEAAVAVQRERATRLSATEQRALDELFTVWQAAAHRAKSPS